MREVGPGQPCLILAANHGQGKQIPPPGLDGWLRPANAGAGELLRATLACEPADLARETDLYYLPSGEITNRPLIEAAARGTVPLLLDTKGAALQEVVRAAAWVQLAFRAASVRPLSGRVRLAEGARCCLLHGAEAGKALHLRAMARMREQTFLPVGFVLPPLAAREGARAAALAVAAGACVLICQGGRGLAAVVTAVREAEALLGERRKQAGAAALTAEQRRGAVAARDLPAGHRLAEGDVVFVPPLVEGALQPWQVTEVMSRTLTQAVPTGQPLRREHLEGSEPRPPSWSVPRPPRERPRDTKEPKSG
jgi:N,N'-diacetyllegionaminate synthase